jgi:hypothetical protein
MTASGTTAAAVSAALHPSLWRTRTVRGFTCTVLVSMLLVGGLSLLMPLEAALFGSSEIGRKPFSSAMQVVGLPHILIGFLFMVTSARMRNTRSRLSIGLALLAGAGLCWVFHLSGGPDASPQIPMAFVGLYFLVHAYRDEWFFYYRYGEEGPRTDRRHLPLLLLGLLCTLLALAWSWAVVVGIDQSRSMRHLFDPRGLGDLQRLALWALPFAIFCALAWLCLSMALARSGRSLGELLSQDRPLWLVYFGVLLVILVCSPLGGKLYIAVLLHVVGWWIFASVTIAQMSRKAASAAAPIPAPVPTIGLLSWMRTTQRGFQTLHGVLALVTLGLLLLYFHVQPSMQGTGWSWVLERDAFYYWTVMHVTVSFVPK